MRLHSLQHQQGMTLLEVLIAVSILTVISAMAFLSIDNMVKAKSSLNQHTAQLNQSNLTYYLLQNDLQFAVSSQQSNLQEAEFMGSSQGFTLLQYKGQTVTSPRIETSDTAAAQPLQRVRWFVRDQWLIRAVTWANGNGYQQDWQERPMMRLKTFSCSYINDAGNSSNQWPGSAIENGNLPMSIRCMLETEAGMVNEFNISPWQKIW